MSSSIVKVAIYENDILPCLKAYSDKFFKVPYGSIDITKYGLLENGMMLMVSQNKTMTNNGGVIYNVMMTIMMNNKELPLDKLKEFEDTMPFKFLPAPQVLIDMLNFLG